MHTTGKILVRALLLLAAALSLAGCASATGSVRYPLEWAKIDRTVTADGCPVVDGTYSDRASGVVPTAVGSIRLSEIFTRMGRGSGPASPAATGHTWPVIPAAKSVTIRVQPEALLLRFIAEDGTATPLSFRRYHFRPFEQRIDDLFTCNRSDAGAKLRFFAEPESHSTAGSPLLVEGGGTLVFLLKAADGSLIVQWRSESLTMLVFVVGSTMHYDSVWSRYPPSPGGE